MWTLNQINVFLKALMSDLRGSKCNNVILLRRIRNLAAMKAQAKHEQIKSNGLLWIKTRPRYLFSKILNSSDFLLQSTYKQIL